MKLNKTEIRKIVEKDLLEFFDTKTLLSNNQILMVLCVDSTLKAINYTNSCSAFLEMEIKQKYIAEYSQTGHPQYPEDTWTSERVVNNVDELFQYMKDLHKRDAYSFNNFPLNGSCAINRFSFSVEKWIEVKGERYINPKREKAEKPEYFDEAAKMYKAFCDRMRRTLPNLRKARDKKQKEKRERVKLAELQAKYGT